jgi:outer membrane protein assembly factor BamB
MIPMKPTYYTRAPRWLRRCSRAALLSTLVCGSTTVFASSDWWPQFRGPNASGISSAKPPLKVGPTEQVRWKVKVPWSPSSPVIWENRIFLSTFQEGQLETRAHDRRTGNVLWARGVKPDQLEVFHRTDGSPAASTPATDGKYVVSYFGSFGVVCYDLEGKEIWRRPLPVALSGGSYGSGASPVIVGDRVLLNRDQDANSSLLALDLKTGKVVWETPRPDMIGGFGTPILWKHEGSEEVVVPGSVRLKAYDVSTGKERWMVEGVSSFVCTTPVLGDGLLYFGAWSPDKADSGLPMDWPSFAKQFDKNGDGKVNGEDSDPVSWEFMRGLDADRDGSVTGADLDRMKEHGAKADNVLVAVRPGGKGDITETHVAWKAGRGLPYVPSPLFYNGRVYLVKDGGMMSSFDAKTGKAAYLQERLGAAGSYYASPVAADGRIYLASLPGKLTVVKAGGETPEILHQVDFGERIFATPALVEGSLYLRTQSHLYAFGSESWPDRAAN